jgi:NAD-dependent dihydropyrimidine dehydrogenase PreA subunit
MSIQHASEDTVEHGSCASVCRTRSIEAECHGSIRGHDVHSTTCHQSVALAVLRQNVMARYEAMMSVQHASQDTMEESHALRQARFMVIIHSMMHGSCASVCRTRSIEAE